MPWHTTNNITAFNISSAYLEHKRALYKTFSLVLLAQFKLIVHRNTQQFIYRIKKQHIDQKIIKQPQFTCFVLVISSNQKGIKMFYNTFVRLHSQQERHNQRLLLILLVL